MSNQNRPEESKWTVVFQRVRLWEARPQPGGLKSFLFTGGSDSGNVEYNGSFLRFAGKKLSLDISMIKSISEVKANLKFFHFILYFVVSMVVLLLAFGMPFRTSTISLVISIALPLVGTVLSWLYLREYGGWVWISYIPSDGQPKDIGFWGPLASGGSQKLYKELSKLFAKPSLLGN